MQALGRYQVLEELGRGGMGLVYRARDPRLGREVALKVLRSDLLDTPELKRRFFQEARALASLQHPGIAVVHEIDEAEGAAFIAMELVRGERLSDYVAREEPALPELLDLALQVAEALGEAHRRGVVHRDLKPANVLVSAEGRVKLIDFGLAKLLDPVGELGHAIDTPAQPQTDPGKILGTTAYLSPEQARGDAVDARSDVFALGALLFEIIAGEPVFLGPSAIETLHAILKKPAPPLPPLGPAAEPCVGDLQRIVDRCLAKDAETRFPHAEAVATELRAVRRRLDAPHPPAEAASSRPVHAAGARLRVAIVDDEALARSLLREYLAAHADLEIVAECANGFEAVKAVSDHRPDLLLLDVQMPKLDGFEVLELIGGETGVIFVTAYDEFALKAFEVHAIDYLLKPVAPERLAAALDRARERLRRREASPPAAELAAAAREEGTHLARILVRQGARVQVIPVEKLDYAAAQDDYVSLRAEGRDHLKEQTLAQLEAQLDPRRFVRIHRSYLLNVDRLAKLELYAKDSRVAILQDGTRLPVSRAGYGRLKQLL